MADEITYQVLLMAEKSNALFPQHGGEVRQATWTNTRVAAGAPSIGFAAHEALPMIDVTAPGWAYFRNADATNYVEIGKDVAAAFHAILRLNAGEECVCRLATGFTAPYAQANTAAVILQYAILDT